MRTITLGGKCFPIRFDMNIMEKIQDRYGEIAEVFEKIQRISECKWVLWMIISEGIAFNNYQNGLNERAPSETEVGMLVSPKDMRDQTITQAIVDAFNDCFGGEKNVSAGELMEEAEKIRKSNLPA